MKTQKGKFVSRSVYQKLAEENKKLIGDIKILVGNLTNGVFAEDKRIVRDKWVAKFEKDHNIKNLILNVIKKQNETT